MLATCGENPLANSGLLKFQPFIESIMLRARHMLETEGWVNAIPQILHNVQPGKEWDFKSKWESKTNARYDLYRRVGNVNAGALGGDFGMSPWLARAFAGGGSVVANRSFGSLSGFGDQPDRQGMNYTNLDVGLGARFGIWYRCRERVLAGGAGAGGGS